MLDILDMSQHNPFLFMVAGQGKLELFVLGWVETRTELNGGIIVKMKMVFCSAVVMALLSAPATAQYLPDIIGDDLAYVDSQWSTAGQAWNLYDLVVPGMATNGNSWGEAPFIDPEATGVSMWGPTTDMTGNGLPDQYELALGTALRYALDEEGGTLLFPEFKAQWDLNDKSVGRFNDDDLATWGGGGMTEPGEGGRSWTGQRRWYTILTTQSQEWEDFFQAGASYFTHASDNGAGSDGGPGCGSTFGGGCGPYPAREQNPFHATLGTPAGDADGDGISNLQEYLDNPTATPLEYALAAITANATAPDLNVVEAVSGTIGGGVTITVSNGGTATGATWTFDGDAIPGETGLSLTLTDLVTGDSGAYVASFDDGEKVANTYTANLTVSAAPVGLPVAGVFGLMALAVGLAAGGTAAVRRRK